MRETGRTIGRLAASRAPLALAVLVGLGAAACGGDGGSSEGQQSEAMNAPAGGPVETPATGGPAETPAGGGTTGGATAQELPAGVTAAMIDEGKKVFTGAGICFSCHGPDAKGVPNLGANLTDGEWLHSDGSLDGIAGTVSAGVAAEKSSSGVPMPPKGGASITDAQVRAVAAYVWTLSHGGKT